MKNALFISLAVVLLASNSFAQDQIFRCGNEYTNTATDAKARGCKPFKGGNITIVQGTKPGGATAPMSARPGAASQPGQRVDAGDQRARDSEARTILESELKKAEARQADLLREYNNGEPEKQGGEARNYQKYLDRVAELKASIARNSSDIAGIRRELDRIPASK